MIRSKVIPSATIDTTVATGMRVPAMHGIPPISQWSTTIRSYPTSSAYAAGPMCSTRKTLRNGHDGNETGSPAPATLNTRHRPISAATND